MGFIDEEYKKGFERAREGKNAPESLIETYNVFRNMFRSDQEQRARERGFKEGRVEFSKERY